MMKKTKAQQVNAKQVNLFLADAEKRVVAARKNLVIDAETAYQIAYEGMIKASLALMLSHGQRPRHQLGHHVAIIEFAQKHFDASHSSMFILISKTEAEDAVQTAEKYMKLIASAIKTKLP